MLAYRTDFTFLYFYWIQSNLPSRKRPIKKGRFSAPLTGSGRLRDSTNMGSFPTRRGLYTYICLNENLLPAIFEFEKITMENYKLSKTKAARGSLRKVPITSLWLGKFWCFKTVRSLMGGDRLLELVALGGSILLDYAKNDITRSKSRFWVVSLILFFCRGEGGGKQILKSASGFKLIF